MGGSKLAGRRQIQSFGSEGIGRVSGGHACSRSKERSAVAQKEEVMEQGVLSRGKKAESFKDQGNVLFREGCFNAAIDAYTKAIALNPDIATYWTNRAQCHRKKLKKESQRLVDNLCSNLTVLNLENAIFQVHVHSETSPLIIGFSSTVEWGRVEADCRKAIELDKRFVKAHYMLGLALLELKQYQAAAKQLEKALDLGRGGDPSVYMVEEIWQEIAKAKYREWRHIACSRRKKHEEVRAFCERAMTEDFQWKLENINKNPNLEPISIEEMRLKKLKEEYGERKQLLSEIFEIAAEQDTPSEIPEYLCCKISMDIFRDPVITPSGVTYERAVIHEHIQKVGKFDPFSRTPLETYQLVPNLAMKEAVQEYLSKHMWAYKTSKNE